MPKPDHGMFGIKLILPQHLEHPFFTGDFSPRDERQTLMNFPDDDRGLAIANNIPVGHRALVYVTQPVGGFLWEIEFIGTIADGVRAARAHGLRGDEYGRWNRMRPIRICARIADPARAVSPALLHAATGYEFRPNSFTHTYISRDVFNRMHVAIPWDVKN